MIALISGLLYIKGIFSLTITTSPEINIILGTTSSLVLNCTFEYDSTEVVTTVHWRKKLPGTDYTGLARFNYNSAIYVEHGLSIEARSNLQTFNAISNSTILNITDVRCEDVGQYQCEVEFSANTNGKRVNESTYVYIQANAEKPAIFSDNPNNSLEEHEILEITCRAEVGGPYGSLEIWKFNLSSNYKTLLKNTSEVYKNTKKCTSVANLTMTYSLSRQDNGIKFRCTSRNKFTEEPAPNSEIGPIEVLYGPSNTRINSFNLNAHSLIGDSIILKCTSDGHPNPNYAWEFNNTKLRNNSKFHISADQSRLSFTVTNIADSGLYKCVAYNEFKGNVYNSSSNVTITVQEEDSFEMEKTCSENSCLFLQNCILRNGRAFCSVNIWIVITIVFISLTLILGTTTISLVFLRRKPLKNPVDIVAEEGDMGGYLSPVGYAEGSNYASLGEETVHVYSTMGNRDLLDHDSNYASLGQETVHVYSTMRNRDLLGHDPSYTSLGQGTIHVYSTMQNRGQE